MEGLSFEFLLGHTLTFGPDRYRLQKVLGGGATAVVFLGVDPGEPENQERQVAVKVARAEEQWQQALAREWRNLRTLAEAEERASTHYFPRAFYPTAEDELRQEVYLEGKRASFLVLIQELVSGLGVHDLLLDYPPGLRLPEPLALEIARQYADMLTILHGAGLTCADRKLPDLRWQKAYDFRTGRPEDLARWRDELPGNLMVLDWNVTERASEGAYGTVALDLFRFGILWHRMLMGVEPRFRRGGGWQLEQPLEKHPLWPQLSFGTRQVLARLLHPDPEQRYRDAQRLLGDVRQQVHLWQARGADLVSRFKPVHGRYVQSMTRAEKAPTMAQIGAAFAAADVLRLRIEGWEDESQPGFDRIHRGLGRAVTEAPFRELREAMTAARWERVRGEIERLEKEYHDPALRLHLDRCRQIATAADQSRSAWERVRPLFERSDMILGFDRPAGPGELTKAEALKDQHIQGWKQEAEAEREGAWQVVKTRLLREAGYRLALARARDLKDGGDYHAASDVFGHVITLRRYLAGHGSEITIWLDQLYGDPTPEQIEMASIVKAGEDISGAFERGLRAIVDVSPTLEEALEGVRGVLQVTPDNLLLGYLYRLLEAAQTCRRARAGENLLLEIQYLGRLRQSWQDLKETPNDSYQDRYDMAGLREILEEYRSDFQARVDRSQGDLSQRVLQRLGAKPGTRFDQSSQVMSEKSDDVVDAWDIRLLIDAYRQVFPDDDEFRDSLCRYMSDCRQQMETILSRRFPRPRTYDGLQKQMRRLDRDRELAIKWAQRGEMLGEIVEVGWPSELSQEAVAKQMQARRQAVLEKGVQAAGCLEFLCGGQRGGTWL